MSETRAEPARGAWLAALVMAGGLFVAVVSTTVVSVALPSIGGGGLKGYVTNLAVCPDGSPVTAQFVIDAYHRLIEVEKSFCMSKHDLAARPIYHHKRDPIEAHLTIVFAALAISRWIEQRTAWSIRKFVRPRRPPLPYRPDPGRRPHRHSCRPSTR